MTELLYSPKIKPEHLARKAIVYLRQSTEKQVRQNQESQRLQYDLGERMHALGWSEVEIIGHDLGASAAIGAARPESRHHADAIFDLHAATLPRGRRLTGLGACP